MAFERVPRVTVAVAARRLGLSRATVLRMIEKGQLDAQPSNPYAGRGPKRERNNSPLLIAETGPRSIEQVLADRAALGE
jgi:hypothetical protein